MNKKIISEITWGGDKHVLEYLDLDSFENIPYGECKQVYGVCFVDDKMVIVYGGDGNDVKGWGLVGGHIKKGETFVKTLSREVWEETNMEVIYCQPIGVQKVISSDGKVIYQLRYMALVKPIGKFKKDPAESVSKIKIINPGEYKKYIDWGEIGDRIIKRAIKLKKQKSVLIS